MVTRREILSKAADDCMKEIYSYAQPSVEWEDFVQQNKDYSKKYNEWECLKKDERPNIHDYCGPRPYEFYYIPKNLMKEIVDSYISAYKIDEHNNLVEIIKILKDYCEKPIVDKYIEDYTDEYGNHHPGYRGYDHPKSIKEAISEELNINNNLAEDAWNKVKEYLDMAEEFFNWNSELNSFNMTVYLGQSPNSNKDAVIENWKKYKGVDIVIDENKYKEEDDEWFNDEDNKES